MNVRIYSVKKNPRIFGRINIFVNKYLNIFEYPNIRYTLNKTSADFMNDLKKIGEKFLGWIERQGAAAVSARLTHQALALSKPQQSAPPVQKCGVCGKGGHKTESCAGSEGKGKVWGLARDQRASLEQEIAGNAFAASGRRYPSGQGIETF